MKTKLQNKEEYKETELGLLPKDWNVVKLKEVCEKMKAGGTPFRGNKEYYKGNIPFVLIEDMTACDLYLDKTKETITEKGLENSNTWIVPINSILLSMYATIGATAINKIPVSTNQAILAIIPKKELDTIFGAYILRYHSERLKMHNIATTQKNVNKGIVENFLIPLPPLAEQQKIAYVLSIVQQAREKTEWLINSLKELKKSAMKHLFTYGATSFEDIDEVKLKNTEIGKMPKEWEIENLGNINTEGTKNITPAKDELYEYYSIPAYQDNKKPAFVKGLTILSQKKILKEDMVLFGKLNPRVEKVWKVKNYSEYKKIGSGEWITILTNQNKVNSDYLFYLEWSDYIMPIAKTLVSGSTPSRQRVDPTSFYKLKVPIPSLSEQQHIASTLSSIDKKIESEEQKKDALEQLFKSLLHNLMSGRIRVKDLKIEVGK